MHEPGMMTEEAKRYLLGVVFQGKDIVNPLWVGLARRPIGDKPELRAFAAGEPKAENYRRQSLGKEDWAYKDGQLKSIPLHFKNDSRQIWTGLDTIFLATTKDDTGILLAWGYLDHMRELFDGDELLVPVSIRF